MLMIRLLAVDMDGTCLNRKNQISEQNMAALRRLVQSGIQSQHMPSASAARRADALPLCHHIQRRPGG